MRKAVREVDRDGGDLAHMPSLMADTLKTAPKKSSGFNLQQAAEEVDDVTRSLPHAVGPEKSLLSTMLQDPQEYIGTAVESKLTAAHFYLPNHSILFGFLITLFEEGHAIELVSLVQRLLDKGLLEKCGGPGYLTELYTYAPSPGHFHHHLQHVKDKFVLRAIIRSSNEAVAMAYEAPDEVPELLDSVEQNILAIRESAETNQAQTMKQTMEEVMRNFQMLLSKEKASAGISTGFEELDKKSGGLKAGEMFVVAARPSMGKTSFMMNIVEHVCLDQNKPCMVFSCEMSSAQLVQRLLFARAKFAVSQLSRGYSPKKQELERVRNASMQIVNSKLFIDDTAGISINELRAKARRKKRDENIEFIAIDYLQLMKSRTKQAENSREREIAEISGGIKALAKELSIPILILAQLNRGPEGRTGKSLGVPRMSDLRESGSIEQDADLVGLLYRNKYYAENDEERAALEGKAELVLAKNRNGETGGIPLTFVEEMMRFETGPPAEEME
ncbi:MAG: replicative DNA helicase [Luteolibacter sp.]